MSSNLAGLAICGIESIFENSAAMSGFTDSGGGDDDDEDEDISMALRVLFCFAKCWICTK